MAGTLRDQWVVIRNSRGLRLAAEFRLPAGPGPHPAVAFAHGLGSMDSERHRMTAETLRSWGISTLLFDFTGQGESEGGAADGTEAQQADDLGSVVDFLRASDLVGGQPIGILGANSTAPVALSVAADGRDIRALVLRGGRVAGAEEVAARVTVPTLLVVGERDRRILADSEAFLSHLAGPRCLAVIPDGDHLLEGGIARGLASTSIAAWFANHLGGEVIQDGLGRALVT